MRILLCGMGNVDRGDDGFGPYIAQRIRSSENIRAIDCQLYPENYLNQMAFFRPDLIVFLDAVERSGEDVVFLRNEEILASNPISISTHKLPFSSIYYYLQENCQAQIWFIGARPRCYNRLSPSVRTTANRIIEVVNLLDNRANVSIMSLYEKISTTLQ